MSDASPANWDTPSTPSQPIVQYILDVVVNPVTSITCVKLPYYDIDAPTKGTKDARQTILQLLEAKNGDVNPLNFRKETDRTGAPDPYYKSAPNWSTLSYGRSPRVTIKPADIARMLTEVSSAVPFVQAVRLYVIGANGTRQNVTLDELNELNLEIKPVPDLYAGQATHSSPGGASGGFAAQLFLDRQKHLEDELAAERNSSGQMRDQVNMLQKFVDQLLSSQPATAASSSSEAGATSADPVSIDDDDDGGDTSKVRGKRSVSAARASSGKRRA